MKSLPEAPRVSLLLHNARVITMDPNRPVAEAVLVAGDRIVCACGGERALRELGHAETQVDCQGHTLLPGFIDAHVHLLAQARALQDVDCAVISIEGLITRLRAAARQLPHGIWLRGRGYHPSMLAERRHPTRHELDRAAWDRPVRIVHASGHASVLNSAGLAAAGITSATPEPPGGTIDRDLVTGEPTGLLIEMEDRLDRAISTPRDRDMDLPLHSLSERLLAAGVTSVQDLGHRNDRQRAQVLSDAVERGSFRPRVTMATGYDAFEGGDEANAMHVARGPVKIMLNESGDELLPGPAELGARVQRVHDAGRQVAIHATQRRSIEAALDAIELAQGSSGIRRRHRIEHASVTPPETARRMARLGVVAVSNPAFLRQHGDRYLQDVRPEDLPHLYDVAGLLQAGVRVAAGSDCPVSPPEPSLGILGACHRRTRSDRPIPGTRASHDQAVSLFTSGAACVAGEEAEKGQIAPGLLADLVLVDLEAATPQPLLTVLGGHVVWRADSPDVPACEAERA